MVLRTGLLISKALPDRPYWHLDMHAGCGWNDKADCPGSPIIAIEELNRSGKSYTALFCERERALCEQLRGRLAFATHEAMGSSANAGTTCQDNRGALHDFADLIAGGDDPRFAMGSVFIDPNGFKEEDVPLDALRGFFAVHRRIDIILNVNVSLFARVRGCKGNPNTPGFDDWPDPADVFGLKPLKNYWLVRNPPRGNGSGGERFIMLVGRNTAAGMTRFEEFYPLESPRGKAIVCDLVRVQPDQPNLPGFEE